MHVNKIVSLSVVILLIAVLFAGAVTVPAVAQTTVQPPTMQYRYNVQHTGDYSPVAGSTPPNNQVKWSFETGYNVASSPAVVNGVVYVGSGDRFGGNTFYALYASNGTELWNYTTGDYVFSSPAVVNGVVYVGSNDHNVYALNAQTGAKLWNYTLKNGVFDSPTVVNGVVYVGGDNCSTDNNVTALNATTGTLKWSYPIGFDVYSAAVENGVVYVGSGWCHGYENNVTALNAQTGAKLWNYSTEKAVYASPAVSNGIVYVGSNDGSVYALYANNGTKLWGSAVSGSVYSSPAVVNGVVYVASSNGNVYALNAKTGATLWSSPTGSIFYSSPAVANGVVYVGSEDHNLYAINANNGTKLWNYTTGAGISSSPAVVNGVVYVGSADGKIYAIGNETVLAISAPSLAAINKPFSVNGTLKTTDGTAIAGATVQLQKNVSGAWQNVTGKTSTTTSTGAYRISTSEPTANTYQYRAVYAGNDTYGNATSPVASVKVVSKASVLADLNTLSLTVLGIPSSSFIPGTKVATLAVIGATRVNVMVGSYGGATAELKSALLPRMDGCARTGTPDSDDWVRTCAAQGQLYPQVQNLIQELQALQGS